MSVGLWQFQAAGNLDIIHPLSVGGGIGFAVAAEEVPDLYVGEVLGVTQRLALVAARDGHDLGRFHGGSDVDTVDDIVVTVAEVASRRGRETDGSCQISTDVSDIYDDTRRRLLRAADGRHQDEPKNENDEQSIHVAVLSIVFKGQDWRKLGLSVSLNYSTK